MHLVGRIEAADINPNGYSSPFELKVSSGNLYFDALADLAVGHELYRLGAQEIRQ